MGLKLAWRSVTTLPVDGTGIRPELFRDLDPAGASRTRLPLGNTTVELGELFTVEGDRGEDRLILEGDLGHVRGIGRGMAAGQLLIEGECGPQLGTEMAGGSIEVRGRVGDWAGAEM